MQLLLVDDDVDALELYQTLFRKQGFEVVAARNGLEALRKLEACTPDVVLTDYWMPEMDGLELLREIRRRAIPTKVVVFTASPKPSAEEWLGAGADLHFMRPTEIPLLFSSLQDLWTSNFPEGRARFSRGHMEAAFRKKKPAETAEGPVPLLQGGIGNAVGSGAVGPVGTVSSGGQQMVI